MMDGMAIRKQAVKDPKKGCLVGYVDLGGIADAETEPELSKETLVFLLVSYTKNFKCPLAYLLVNKVPGVLQAQMVICLLNKLQEIGITVRSLTCDGATANIATMELLGCNLDYPQMQPNFKHPSGDHQVYAFLDPCHMIKLARNCLADKEVIQAPDGEIKWKFIVNLHEIQKQEGWKFANKLSENHIRYENKKMCVRLAVQVFSDSVADAIDFLRKSGYPQFQNSEATIHFIRLLNKLFDILNSRTIYGKHFKSPLTKSHVKEIMPFLLEAEQYLMSLTIEGKPILNHRRKTFALGFLTCIKNITLLAEDLFREYISFLLTYKISQDHLELVFAAIRAMGGCNNNPNVTQLKAALRRLLLKNYIKPNSKANCSFIDTGNFPDAGVCDFSQFGKKRRKNVRLQMRIIKKSLVKMKNFIFKFWI